MKSSDVFYWFRKIAMIEGVSFLVLLFIAMPLKYMADSPSAVRIVGGLHGALFVAFLLLAFAVMYKYKKNLYWLTKAFISSLIPFGTFVMEKQWKKENSEQLSIRA